MTARKVEQARKNFRLPSFCACKMPQIKNRKVSITQRAQAMALAEFGVPISIATQISGLSKHAIYSMRKRLRARGYNPEVSTVFEDRFFKDAPPSGRPKKTDLTKRAAQAEKAGEQVNADGGSLPSEPASPTPDDLPALDTPTSDSTPASPPTFTGLPASLNPPPTANTSGIPSPWTSTRPPASFSR